MLRNVKKGVGEEEEKEKRANWEKKGGKGRERGGQRKKEMEEGGRQRSIMSSWGRSER